MVAAVAPAAGGGASGARHVAERGAAAQLVGVGHDLSPR